MKRLLTLCLVLCLAMAVLPVTAFSEGEQPLRIAVASDLHLEPDNTCQDGEVSAVQYSPELVDALLRDAREQGADMILLTGDLVNGGKQPRLDTLQTKLHRAEADGLEVLVLPGNHDLAPATQTEFAQIFAEFGFDEAYSRDLRSLSYCIVRDRLMILMMDTAGYSTAAIDLPDAPKRSSQDGFFTEETLRWAEEMLEKAKAEGLYVLAAGHYNLLTELSRQPGSGFCVENGDRFAQLLQKYAVPLYLSGHIHTRTVYHEGGLTELVTEYLLAYPTGYTLLDLTTGGICCSHRRIDVDSWARETGQTDEVLLNYAEWQQENLRSYSVSNVEYMSKRNPLSRRKAKQASEFFYEVMNAFWDGSLCEKRTELEAMPGYDAFFKVAEGYAYGWWLKDLIENATPEMAEFSLNWR